MLKAFIVLLTLLLFTGQNAVAGFISGFEPVWEKYERQKIGAAGSERTSGAGYADSTTGMEFVFVKGGCFMMGSNDGGDDEKPVHEVCVDDFYLGKFEVTNAQYRKYIAGHDSKSSKGKHLNDDSQPAVYVSWDNAVSFAGWLTQKSGKSVRLPTEAEWEYAARSGGKREKYAGSDNVNVVAWYDGNSGKITHPVGQKDLNGLGLYDMSGNVWEWTGDQYDKGYYGKSPRQNPQGPSGVSLRVLRGGGWSSWPNFVRTANRSGYMPSTRDYDLGFRLAFPAR